MCVFCCFYYYYMFFFSLLAIQWSHRRDLLDQQEKAMLSRVRELRQKVAGRMSSNAHHSPYPTRPGDMSATNSTPKGASFTPDTSFQTPGCTVTPHTTPTTLHSRTSIRNGHEQSFATTTTGGSSFWTPLKSQ